MHKFNFRYKEFMQPARYLTVPGDSRTFQIYVDYVRAHGHTKGPLSTLSLDRQVRIEATKHGGLP